jgi:hypothetical protein
MDKEPLLQPDPNEMDLLTDVLYLYNKPTSKCCDCSGKNVCGGIVVGATLLGALYVAIMAVSLCIIFQTCPWHETIQPGAGS